MSRDKSGMASTIAAEEGVATFEQCQQKKRKAEEELARLVGLQSGKWEPGVEDSQVFGPKQMNAFEFLSNC